MDYTIHVSNESKRVKPLVVRLPYDKETTFNLRVVNKCNPSYLSLQVNGPISESVHLPKVDHYVNVEETIPLILRMPVNKKQLDGELFLASDFGTVIVPVSLLQENKKLGEDLLHPFSEEDELLEDSAMASGQNDKGRHDENDDIAEYNYSDEERTEINEDVDEDEYISNDEYPGFVHDENARDLRFSMDDDLLKYRSASVPSNSFKQQSSSFQVNEKNEDYLIQKESDSDIEEHDFKPNPTNNESYVQYLGIESMYQSEIQSEKISKNADNEVEIKDESEYNQRSLSSRVNPMQIIGGALFAVVLILILTFLTKSLPEYPGALATSILIVTLIIYGVATLLKA